MKKHAIISDTGRYTSTTHQSAISLAEDRTLVDKDVLRYGAPLGWGDEPIALLVGEPFDASLHLFRHGYFESRESEHLG